MYSSLGCGAYMRGLQVDIRLAEYFEAAARSCMHGWSGQKHLTGDMTFGMYTHLRVSCDAELGF